MSILDGTKWTLALAIKVGLCTFFSYRTVQQWTSISRYGHKSEMSSVRVSSAFF